MSHSFPLAEARQLHRLCGACVDQHISADDFEALCQLLRNSDEARRFYVEYVDLHGRLGRQYRRVPLPPGFPEGETAESVATIVPSVIPPVPLELATAMALPTPMPDTESPHAPMPAPLVRHRYFTRMQLAGMVVVCSVLFASYVLLLFWGMLDWPGRSARLWVELARDEVSPPRDSIEGPIEPVATITASNDARWRTEDASASNQKSEIRNQKSEILPGKPLVLAAGIVHLNLKQGTALAIEGPAEWTVVDGNRIRLQVGRLLATVPHQATGFTVETPTVKVVDLGTQFRVVVDPRGATEARVVRGLIEIEKRDIATQAFGPSPGVPIRLSAGQMARIDHLGDTVSIVTPPSGNLQADTEHLAADRVDGRFDVSPAAEPDIDDGDANESVLLPLDHPLSIRLVNGDFDATPLPEGTGSQTIPNWFESTARFDPGNDRILRNSRRIRSNKTNVFASSRWPGFIYQQIGTYRPGTMLELAGEIHQVDPTTPDLRISLYVGNISGQNGRSLASLRANWLAAATVSPRQLRWNSDSPLRFSTQFKLHDPAFDRVPLWLEVSRVRGTGRDIFLDNLTLTTTHATPPGETAND